ncbi:MAG: PQQ-like beta-propeller repeat protein, partial [Deltaproteobacteria bacterium]|nr:PQQ-like beta-propeller repeat protein [Deltaproteobacteria bacterium]
MSIPRTTVFCSLLFVACSSSEGARPAAPSVPLQADSPWPKFRGNAAQDGRSAQKPKPGGKAWTFRTGKGIFSSPIVAADGTVYVGSADRNFYALNADGTLRWKVATGEIVDSAGLLDDRGRVYFGSGDGKLRALDAATGREIWSMTADAPSVNKAFINWFEGNVAIGPGGTLYVPNDNFFLYAIDREDGRVKWRRKMPDQTWSLPAVDAPSGTLFVGNNNLLPALGRNTFALDPASGEAQWETSTLGSIAASPMFAEGRVIVGGFDGWVRAYDEKSGDELWAFATRDHVYASPALLPDGTVVQPSADGTVYALDPKTGALRWAFDAGEPIRSSPAVDADGNVYFGGGDGRLWVLGPDGRHRWSVQLIAEARNDLNASPALGRDAIYLAGESGEVFSVPYDLCLRAEPDPRCRVGGDEPLARDGAFLLYTTASGAILDAPPSAHHANRPITLSLVLREKGDTRLSTIDASTLDVRVEPKVDVAIEVAGDGKFLTITPLSPFVAGADGKVRVSATAKLLVDHDREGLRLKNGKAGGGVRSDLALTLADRPKAPAKLAIPTTPGEPATTWEMARLALP